MSDQVDLRGEMRERWGKAARGWNTHRDAFRTNTLPVASWMVDAISPQPGQTVLELAAGVGDVGFLAAELIKPNGTLICSDFSPEMLTAAQDRAKELKIDNVRFRQIDGESIGLEAASVDGILCRWGYMLMPDPHAALRESRRILKQGGRIALAAWTSPQDNPWASIGMRELIADGVVELDDPVASDQFLPGQFAWDDKQLIVDALHTAGFTEFVIDAVEFSMRYTSFEDWWQTRIEMAPQLVGAVSVLPADKQEEIDMMLRDLVASFIEPDESLVMPAKTWVAAAELAV